MGHLGDAFAYVNTQNSPHDYDASFKGQAEPDVNEAMLELPRDVVLHNDQHNSMLRVVVILMKVSPGITYKRTAGIMYEAHKSGRAVAKSCHKELAELYEKRLLTKGLTVTIEPA